MKYGSVCSGIEAATVAWHPLGWKPSFFSEIDKAPRRVLAHHYPTVPLHGDFTTIGANDYDAIDLLVGGTPCQSFSVAGLRKGLADERGNLALEYIRLAQRLKPRWLVWENVPGVLSSGRGRDFGSFLGGLAECGYGFSYRVLDAQYFGVPQRRRRVFVVGYLGDWRPAAAVLFERESLRGDITPCRETGEEVAGAIGARTCRSIGAQDADCGHIMQTFDRQSSGEYGTEPVDSTVSARDYKSASDLVTHIDGGNLARTLGARADGSPCHDRGPDVIAIHETGQGYWKQDEVAGTLRAEGENRPSRPSNVIASFKGGQGSAAGGIGYDEHLAPTLSAADSGTNRTPALMSGMQVRRLTPVECERLQGFPDGYTGIPKMADGLRYKMLGNSMAVPVMRWIGERIEMVNAILAAEGRG